MRDDPSELKSKFKSINHSVNETSKLDQFVNRFSNYTYLKRSTAYCFRFVRAARHSVNLKLAKPSTINSNITLIAPLTVTEIQQAEIAIIRWLQAETFHSEINAIKNKKSLPKTRNYAI